MTDWSGDIYALCVGSRKKESEQTAFEPSRFYVTNRFFKSGLNEHVNMQFET